MGMIFEAGKVDEKYPGVCRVRRMLRFSHEEHQASPSMGFFQARILEWGDIPFSRASSQLRE